MRLLFVMDEKNYDPAGRKFSRPSVRGIIRRAGKIAMVHALKHDYYKFPGGGMEPGEDQIETLIREVREESGLQVLPESVEEYGEVYRIEKGHPEDVFEQENFYYLCEVAEGVGPQALDRYELEEGFTLEWVDPEKARETNLRVPADHYLHWRMAQREAGVLQKILEE